MYKRRLSQLTRLSLLFTLLSFASASANNTKQLNGEWQLTVRGTSLFFYGTRILTAGLHQDWEVVIDIRIRNQQFDVASGKARLIGEPVPYSLPEDMFRCESIQGSYLDRGLHEVTTPHIRYEGFPVAGKLVGKQLTLLPDVVYIGNFIAMMYECQTDNTLGSVWLERGQLSSQERGKRQDAKVNTDGKRYSVKIKELQFMEPRGAIEIPLLDGLKFTQHDQASFSEKTFELRLIKQ